SMHAAMEVARRREDHLVATRRGRADARYPETRRAQPDASDMVPSGRPPDNSRPNNSTRPLVKHLTLEEIKRRREKGLCFKCEERFTPGHQCKQTFMAPQGRREMTTAEVVAQFRGFSLEKFSGNGDPRLVEEWIQGLESIFEITEYTDRHRILCAQLQMTGDARLWWNAYWGMRPGEKEHLTWIQFKEMLEEKYYPAHYRAEMERQFLALKQGDRPVGEYEREFTRLGS
ncbi:Unknown protein, partial [Striga hermonthica]